MDKQRTKSSLSTFMFPINEKNFWKEFIELYRRYPELWMVKSYKYRTGRLKENAYNTLVKKLKEKIPNANKDMVKKKISLILRYYSMEMKMQKEHRDSGAREKLKPKLWYFNYLDFLKNRENSDEEYECDSNNIIAEELVIRPLDTQTNTVVVQNTSAEYISATKRNLSKGENDEEANILGKSWALEFKRLEPDQQMFAKKAINDIFFEGRQGNLDRHSVRINEIHTSQSAVPKSTSADYTKNIVTDMQQPYSEEMNTAWQTFLRIEGKKRNLPEDARGDIYIKDEQPVFEEGI